jgi:hypothetical protein
MGKLLELVKAIEARYTDATVLEAGSPPDAVEKELTITTLRNTVMALEAFDETRDKETQQERMFDLYAVAGIVYPLISSLQKLARETLGEEFSTEPGTNLDEFGAVRRLLAHPVNLWTRTVDKTKGVAPAGALVSEGALDAATMRRVFVIVVLQKGYDWGEAKFKPFNISKVVALFKTNLENDYLPKILDALPGS